MTLAASIETNDGTVTLTGIVIALSPTYDPNALQELWRAADSAGAPDSANAVRIAALAVPTGGFNYVDRLPTDGTIWWYRTRMTGGPYGDSTYGDWVNLGTAARLAKDGAVSLGVVSAAASSPAWTQATSRPGTHTQQMVPNFGFEDGLAFWLSVAGTITVLTDSTKAHSGNKYLQVTSTTGNAASATACDDASRARYFEVSPGDVVQFGGYAYQESGTANVRYKLEMTDKDKGGATTALTGNQNTAAWVLVQAQQVIPAGVKYVRLLPDVDATGTGVVARFDDVFLRIAFGASTIHNAQGSMLPLAIDSIFTTQTAFPAGRTPWIGVTWPSRTIQRSDGSTFSLPASSWTTAGPAGALPAAPTLADQGATGALPANTYFFRIGYVKNGWIVSIGSEASITVALNHTIRVTGPAAPTNNWYDGFVVLIGTAANTEAMESATGGTTLSPKAFGTNVDYTAVGSLRGGAYSDATSGSLLALNSNGGNLGGSTDYYVHPYIDPGSPSGYVLMPGNPQAVADTALMTNAAVQWADTHMPLTFGGIKVTTLASGGSGGGGSGGGGRLLK